MKSLSFILLLLSLAFARGEGMRLDASQSVYEVPSSSALDVTNEVSVEAWVKADRMPSAGGRILDRHIPNGGQGFTLDTWPGNSLRLLTSTGTCRFDAKLDGSRWTHVVGVYSAAEKSLKLYIDGVQVSSTNGGGASISNVNAPLRIGSDPNGGTRFVGWIKRAALYNRALTLREIIRRSGALDPQPLAGVMGEWVFPEKPGDKIEPVAGSLVLQRAMK